MGLWSLAQWLRVLIVLKEDRSSVPILIGSAQPYLTLFPGDQHPLASAGTFTHLEHINSGRCAHTHTKMGTKNFFNGQCWNSFYNIVKEY